jgi:hypothetical protein
MSHGLLGLHIENHHQLLVLPVDQVSTAAPLMAMQATSPIIVSKHRITLDDQLTMKANVGRAIMKTKFAKQQVIKNKSLVVRQCLSRPKPSESNSAPQQVAVAHAVVVAAMRATLGVRQQHEQQLAASMLMVRMSQLGSMVMEPLRLPVQKSNAMMELNLILCALKAPSVMEVRKVDLNMVWCRLTTREAGSTIGR